MDFGWKQIWKLYGWRELFSKKNKLFYFSVIVVALAVASVISVNERNLTYILIKNVLNIDISILPTLLGFNLGAYALIIGFLSNKNLLDALTEKHGDNSSLAIEKISGIFAINIITQAFTLLFAFLVQQIIVFIESIHLSQSWENMFYSNNYVTILNLGSFFIILFLTIYSIALVIQNAINIFDFNQLFTYFSLKDEDTKK